MSILVRYGSRSKTEKQTVKIKCAVRLALLTIGQNNGAVKNGSVKKTENGRGTVRYGHGSGDKLDPYSIN